MSAGLFRVKGSHNEHKVSFSELFFDLVFVYAITQTTHLLIHHFTPYGAFQAMLLLLAVWWVWVFTAWVTNWLDPERIPVRLVLFALMLLGMILSISIPEAFGKHGMLFALAYVTMQLGRTLFFCLHSRKHDPVLHNDFLRMSLWFALAAVFWIAGALQIEKTRTILWTAALVLEYLSASLSFRVPGLGRSDSGEWKISGAHMAERCGLLVIIALGESLLVTGNSFAERHWGIATITSFLSAFVATVAMWWIYFSLSAERASERMNKSEHTGAMARLVYTYIHFLIIAGIVLTAAADEFILAHASGHVSLPTLVAVIGGPALYLVGNILFKTLIFNSHPRSHYLGLILLAFLVPVHTLVSPAVLAVLSTAILVIVACWETVVVLRSDHC
ncbi:low temperature requirement protein A [Microbulbifer rhizosphaerae]|uniref:Low temperature requirement protein LtrA n=1 Tax=Microbulbifer rhizosphaerae TaxID=1562603 RepID=A0A7W4Z808_9GAMM|nr:low temperature requirement protein A [Microbulbifer rhizosphaerae]MBB3060087.1 low temperature requirement protein LtrA [Microbulbifer rhizosphaerae]